MFPYVWWFCASRGLGGVSDLFLDVVPGQRRFGQEAVVFFSLFWGAVPVMSNGGGGSGFGAESPVNSDTGFDRKVVAVIFIVSSGDHSGEVISMSGLGQNVIDLCESGLFPRWCEVRLAWVSVCYLWSLGTFFVQGGLDACELEGLFLMLITGGCSERYRSGYWNCFVASVYMIESAQSPFCCQGAMHKLMSVFREV